MEMKTLAGEVKSFSWKALKVFGLGGAMYAVYVVGVQQAEIQYVRGETVEVVKEVVVEKDPDVFTRIADCESGDGTKGSGKQFTAKGNLVINTNTNGTSDVGKWQINLSADKVSEMAKLGINPFTEEGNYAYAKVLFNRNGTSDWNASQKCWRK
jgi:hypothetical protein